MTDSFKYQGEELDLFAHAHNWKHYWASKIRPWVHGDVLEVGAGIGTNTQLLQNPDVRSWHSLEPDPELSRRLQETVNGVPGHRVTTGTIASITGDRYDSILYIDVLEHIERDREEVCNAADLLRPGGHVIVLSPAQQFLFSEFDRAIGHFRRYDAASLRRCSPETCNVETIFYLDAVGMAASLANRVLLKQNQPTVSQIQTWDTYIIPLSRILDPIVRVTGKTIVGVWTRKG
jgi:SAM-dependent methyltransferase